MEFDRATLQQIEQELSKLDPTILQYFLQKQAEDTEEARKIIDNALGSIPTEEQVRLPEPQRPQPFRPTPPPRAIRERRASRRAALLRPFDPFPPHNIRNVTDYQNVILDLYNTAEHEGVEETTGRRYTRWRWITNLDEDLTPKFMAKIRENVHSSFYIRRTFSYRLRNIEDDTVIVYYKNHGSHWFDRKEKAEQWLREQERNRLEVDNVDRPNIKWVFDSYFNCDIKVVRDRQPLLGTGPLPDWLRNLSHSRNMAALDNFQDNLCLWRCIAVKRGARPDCCTSTHDFSPRLSSNLRMFQKTLPKHHWISLTRWNNISTKENLYQNGSGSGCTNQSGFETGRWCGI